MRPPTSPTDPSCTVAKLALPITRLSIMRPATETFTGVASRDSFVAVLCSRCNWAALWLGLKLLGKATPPPVAWTSRRARSFSRRSAMSWFSSWGAGAWFWSDIGAVGPGADKAHAAQHYVEKRRLFIDVGPPPPAPRPGDAGVGPHGNRRPRSFRTRVHGAELDDAKQPACAAHALLAKECRAGRIPHHPQCHGQQHGREQQQPEGGQEQVEQPLGHVSPAPRAARQSHGPDRCHPWR